MAATRRRRIHEPGAPATGDRSRVQYRPFAVAVPNSVYVGGLGDESHLRLEIDSERPAADTGRALVRSAIVANRQPTSPVVSVIIATRDYASFLPEAIDSVLAQSLGSWECLVVDDGSTDSTPALLERLALADPRISTQRQAATGVSAARNRGLAMARGRYIQFLDADDRLAPTKLDVHAQLLDSRPDADIVYGPVRYVTEPGAPVVRTLRDPTLDLGGPLPDASGEEVAGILVVRNLLPIEAPLVRRDALARVGGFNEAIAMLEDWDLWLRLALADARFVFCPQPDPVAQIRIHGTSVSQDEAAMLAAEVNVRQLLTDRLAATQDLARRNALGIASRRVELAVHRAAAGRILGGMGEIAVLAVRWRRPRWLIWAALLPLATFGFGRRLLGWIRRRMRYPAARPLGRHSQGPRPG